MIYKSFLVVFLLFMFNCRVFAQSINSWYDLFASNRLYNIELSDDYIYVASENVLTIYNRHSEEIDRISFFNGLSDVEITDIMYDTEYDLLVIIYASGNIDILKNSEIYNLPYIKENRSILNKKLNAITKGDNLIYLAGDFGVIKVNPQNLTFEETCFFPNVKVNDIAYFDGYLFAATNEGIFFVNPSVNFVDFNDWHKVDVGSVSFISAAENYLYYSQLSDVGTKIFRINGGLSELILDFSLPAKFKVINNRLYVYSLNVDVYTLEGIELEHHEKPIELQYQYINDLEIDGQDCFCADAYSGVCINYGQDYLSFESAFNNNAIYIKSFNDDLYILYKPDSIDQVLGINAIYSIKTEKDWQHYTLNIGSYLTSIVIDPTDYSHFFLGTNGSGLVELYDNKIQSIYNSSNSPLAGYSGEVVISDMYRDKSGVLWILSKSSRYPLVKLLPDLTWEIVPSSNVVSNYDVRNFILANNGWIFVSLYGNGLMLLDPALDVSRVFSPLSSRDINYVSQDIDGTIWLATSDGVAYLSISDFYNIAAIRPKVEITLNDTTIYAYLLDNVKLYSIKSDPGNRKWITSAAGIYWLSPDVQEQIGAFNEYNAIIPTNNVYNLFMNSQTGSVYFTTDLGILVYRSDVTASRDDFVKVKVFPNPVRPDYNGLVTITGLMYNTLIKIIDVQGNLVYETRSNGGTATWNMKTLDGQSVSSGVYLVICYDEGVTQKCIKKILIVR